MELSPETCRVKPLRRINAIVASCWIYFTIKAEGIREEDARENMWMYGGTSGLRMVNIARVSALLPSTYLPLQPPPHTNRVT